MTIRELNNICANSMAGFLGIEFTELEKNCLKARMPVSKHGKQPFGYLHGGAIITLAETLASCITSVQCGKNQAAFGYHVTANLVAPVRQGYVYAATELCHKGRSSFIWDVVVKNETGSKVALCRVTVKIVENKHDECIDV